MKITKTLAGFGCLLMLVLGGRVSADEYHYTNILIGDRASGMGGAYSAVSDDPSGLYYNPAGIAYARSSNLSASVNAFNITSTTYKSALGGTRDWTRSASSLLPNFFGIVQPLGKGVVGFSYAVPDNIVEDQDQTFSGFPANLNQTTVSSYTINFNQNDTTYKFGPSYAVAINDDFSIGLTLYYHYRDLQRILNQYVVLENAEGGGYEWSNSYLESSEQGLQPMLGLMWSAGERLALGLTVSKNYLLSSETTRQITSHSDFVFRDANNVVIPFNAIIPPTTSSHQDTRTLPLQVRLGAAWFHSDRLLLAADVLHSTAHEYTLGGATVKREAVTDVAVGAEYYLTNTWALRGGAYTSRANTPKIEGIAFNQEEHVDIFGVTGSISRYTRNSSLTFGVGYSAGDGRAQLFGNTTAFQEVETRALTAYLSSSYSY